MTVSDQASTTFYLPSAPPGPPVIGIIPPDVTPIVLNDFDIPPHLNIRDFRSSLKPIQLTTADLDYHTNRYWETLTSSSLTQVDAPILGDEGWLTYGLTQTQLDLLDQDDLDLLTQSQIESSAGIGEVAAWRYSSGIIVTVPTGGVTFTSTFDHDNLMISPFDQPGTYYIELILRDLPAAAATPHLNTTDSYISFSSDVSNTPADTDIIHFSDSITSISAGGNVVWRINRNQLVNCDITNIKRIDFFLKAVGGSITFKAEALRLIPSTYQYYTIGTNTKTGQLTKNPSQHGSDIDAQPDPQPLFNVGTNQGVNFSEIIRFNTGHNPTAPNYNQMILYLRADEGSGQYIEVDLRTNATETLVSIYDENGVGVRQLSVDPLTEGADHYLQIDMIEENMRVVIWEAVGNYPTVVKLNTETDGSILVNRVEPGRIAIDLVPFNADFTVDYMFARDASVAELVTKNFESITPVSSVTLYSNFSPPRQILDTSSIEEGLAVNLLRIPVKDSGENNGDFLVTPNLNDVSVSLDTVNVFGDSTGSYLVKKHVANAFIGGVQWHTTVKINDPLNAIITGAVKFDSKLNYGKFRVVLFDKFFENVAFVSVMDVDTLVVGKWNEFSIPILNERIYNNEFKVQFQHIGLDTSYLSNDTNAVGQFWIDNFKIQTDTVVWEASNDNGLTYMRFFDTIGHQYQGINFPMKGNQFKLRARAFNTNAWINGYQAIVHYASPGRILE